MDKNAAFEYQINAEQAENQITNIHTHEVDTVLECVTPPEFPNGIPGYWSPETYFLAAIAGCFVNTYQALSVKFGIEPIKVSCAAKGTVEIVGGTFAFSSITLTPSISISSEVQEEKALKVAEKAHKYCLVSNSVKCPILLDEQVQIQVLAMG